MVCLYCKGKTEVINSRHQKKLNQVWRRRRCLICKSVFSSLEAVDLHLSLSFRTSQNVIQPFSRDKLFLSIHSACKHRKNAVTASTALTDTVITKLRPHMQTAVVDRETLIKITQAVLKRFDKAAFTYYRAYHPL